VSDLLAGRTRRRCPSAGALAALAVLAAALVGGCGGHSRALPTTTATSHVRQWGRIGSPESLGGVPTPFPHQVFHVTSMWLGHRGRVWINVYAGYPPYARHTWQLRETWTDSYSGDENPRYSGTFTPSRPARDIRITAVDWNTVHFVFAGGNGTFDLVTHAFRLS
jgi:hypothetical protein